jgi:hypothetical protein
LSREEQVPLDAILVKMRLSRDVFDFHGNRLLPAGTCLSQQMIERLHERGIDQVWVWVKRVLSPQEHERCRRQVEERLAERFASTLEQPLMRALYEQVLAYRLEDCDER